MSILDKNVEYFGIDIGSTGIRLVQIKRTGGNPALVTFGDVATPANLLASDSAGDRERLAGIIKQLVKDTRVSTKNVVAGLPSSKVFASLITTPKLSQTELAKAIRYQADQYIPMAVDQVKLDWAVLGQGKNENELEVLLVAAANTATNKYLEVLEKAGLEILALETNATALSRSLLKPTSPAVVILDIGSTQSDITVVLNGLPRLIRSVSVGGTTFIKSVSQNLGLDEGQATQFTYKFGLTQSKLEGQVFKAIKTSLDLLTDEVNKSNKFFIGRYPQAKLEKIVLTGSTVALPELPTYLASATGLPVEISNAWMNVAYPARMQEKLLGVSGQYGVAVGLALRAFV